MATITPTWTDNVSVIATASLARNASTSGTVDARGKWGARFMVRIARTGTAALTNGVDALIRPAPNNNGIGHPGATWSVRSQTAAANSTTVNADSNSGQKTLNVAATTGMAAGDFICVNQGGAREEWARVARVTSSTALLLDRNLQFTHTSAQADTVLNKADCWTVDVPGGTVWECVLDYGDDSAGDSVRVHVVAQTFDSVATA